MDLKKEKRKYVRESPLAKKPSSYDPHLPSSPRLFHCVSLLLTCARRSSKYYIRRVNITIFILTSWHYMYSEFSNIAGDVIVYTKDVTMRTSVRTRSFAYVRVFRFTYALIVLLTLSPTMTSDVLNYNELRGLICWYFLFQGAAAG